jgi:hypothetical protein
VDGSDTTPAFLGLLELPAAIGREPERRGIDCRIAGVRVAFHVSDISRARGRGDVFIQSRKDAASSGTFLVQLDVHFDRSADNYPAGSLIIKVDLSDSAKGAFTATSIELINSYGKHNPTIYLTGRCNAETPGQVPRGCRYWLMIANNKKADDLAGTADIVGFAIHDRTGNRIATGRAP